MSENPVNSRESDTKGGPVENWDRVVHKNVRTSDNQGFGKVIAIPTDGESILVTSQGGSNRYLLPKSVVDGFNGAELILGVTAAEMSSYKKDEAQLSDRQPSDLTAQKVDAGKGQHTIPLAGERLKVTKHTKTETATIRKVPVKETKTIEIPITYEELILERRPASGIEAEPPTESAEELRIALNREEFEISKEPYVKEELVIRKEPKTETKTITETVRSERIADADPSL